MAGWRSDPSQPPAGRDPRAFLADFPQRVQRVWHQFRVWFTARTLLAKIALVSVFLVCGVPTLCCGPAAVLTAAFGGMSVATATPAATGAAQPAATRQSAAPTATHRLAVPTATATAIPTATPVPLPLAITCASAQDFVSGRVCVHTAPGAHLTITVSYCSGRDAKSASLGPAVADGNGNHEWDWVPQTTCKGPATASVSASLNGQTATASQGFQVT
jgi:hypothetical protein